MPTKDSETGLTVGFFAVENAVDLLKELLTGRESVLASSCPVPRRAGPYESACFAPIASAMIAVTRLLMLTPSFSACFVSFA